MSDGKSKLAPNAVGGLSPEGSDGFMLDVNLPKFHRESDRAEFAPPIVERDDFPPPTSQEGESEPPR